jgi:hypothetical protein
VRFLRLEAALGGSGCFAPLILPRLLLPHLVRVQPGVAPILATPPAAQQAVLAPLELGAALHTPQPCRWRSPSSVNTLPVLLTPPPCCLSRTRPTPGAPPARQLEVRTERRERQHLPAMRTTPPLRPNEVRRPNPREHPDRPSNPHKLLERHPLIHRVRMPLAESCAGETPRGPPGSRPPSPFEQQEFRGDGR